MKTIKLLTGFLKAITFLFVMPIAAAISVLVNFKTTILLGGDVCFEIKCNKKRGEQ